jgi:hypothetical protein
MDNKYFCLKVYLSLMQQTNEGNISPEKLISETRHPIWLSLAQRLNIWR